MQHETFDELRASGRLPTPPGVGMAVLKITQREDFSTEDLSRAISADPALTGRLLQIANSATHAGVRPATTVADAAMRLGVRAVRNVALGFSLLSAHRTGACARFDYDRFWSASLARAVAARAISERLAAWTGPMNRPSAPPTNQNAVSERTSNAAAPRTTRAARRRAASPPATAIEIVCNG